jgi:hypothetical protein
MSDSFLCDNAAPRAINYLYVQREKGTAGGLHGPLKWLLVIFELEFISAFVHSTLAVLNDFKLGPGVRILLRKVLMIVLIFFFIVTCGAQQ